jgi:hypothetical protein
MSSLKQRFGVIALIAVISISFAVFLRYRDKGDMNCIFCDIVDKKTATEFVYEDEVANR